MKTIILATLAALTLAGCDGSSKGSIWGAPEDRGITGVWSQEGEKHCSYYGNCDAPEPPKMCETYGNCGKGDE